MRPKLSPEPEPQGPPPTGPRTCRRRPMTAGVNPWMLNLAPAFVGTHQDLLGGYEAGSLLIADSERVADCRPSLIAPNAEYAPVTDRAPGSPAAPRSTIPGALGSSPRHVERHGGVRVVCAVRCS